MKCSVWDGVDMPNWARDLGLGYNDMAIKENGSSTIAIVCFCPIEINETI